MTSCLCTKKFEHCRDFCGLMGTIEVAYDLLEGSRFAVGMSRKGLIFWDQLATSFGSYQKPNRCFRLYLHKFYYKCRRDICIF